jgi:hypothetical protein
MREFSPNRMDADVILAAPTSQWTCDSGDPCASQVS